VTMTIGGNDEGVFVNNGYPSRCTSNRVLSCQSPWMA